MNQNKITFAIWKQSLRDIFCFSLWWRIVTIMFIWSILTELFTDSFSDVNFVSKEGVLYLSSLLIFLLFSLFFEISLNLIVRDYFKKTFHNPLKILFTDSIKYFYSFLKYRIRVVWYMLWPFLLIAFIAYFPDSKNVSSIILVAVIPFFLYRIIRPYFSSAFFFDSPANKKQKAIFLDVLNFADNQWWRLYFCFVSTLVLWTIINSPIILGDYYFELGLQNLILVVYEFDFDVEEILMQTLFGGQIIAFPYILYKNFQISQKEKI